MPSSKRSASTRGEIEDGKLQLSIYTMKGNDFMDAAEQKAAMAKAKVPLVAASETAVNGKGEGAFGGCQRDGGERQCRVPGGGHRP
jgi:hypothetical protein